MTEPKKPADRQSKQPTEADRRKAREALADQLAAGLDLSPFTIDLKDGQVWEFTPDLTPAQLTSLQDVAQALGKGGGVDGMAAGFDQAVEVLRSLLIREDQRALFPLPVHGIRAISFLLSAVMAGKSGLPTTP